VENRINFQPLSPPPHHTHTYAPACCCCCFCYCFSQLLCDNTLTHRYERTHTHTLTQRKKRRTHTNAPPLLCIGVFAPAPKILCGVYLLSHCTCEYSVHFTFAHCRFVVAAPKLPAREMPPPCRYASVPLAYFSAACRSAFPRFSTQFSRFNLPEEWYFVHDQPSISHTRDISSCR